MPSLSLWTAWQGGLGMMRWYGLRRYHVFMPSLSLWTAWRGDPNRFCLMIWSSTCILSWDWWGVGRWFDVRHQPTHLGREPRVCTAGCRCRPLLCDDMPHDALMWGHGGKHARNLWSWAWAVRFPWGQPRCRMGKSGRPHILYWGCNVCVWRWHIQRRRVLVPIIKMLGISLWNCYAIESCLVMFWCQACRCGRPGTETPTVGRISLRTASTVGLSSPSCS